MHSTYKQIILLLTAMTISAVIILLSAARGLTYQRSSAVEKQSSMTAQDDPGFVLGEHGGRLALFREHCSKPYRILDMPVYLLPEADKEALQSGGITVATEEELQKLLEDWDQ